MVGKWRVLCRFVGLERVEVPVYFSSSPRGRVPLFKTLFSNWCKMSCLYCPFRSGGVGERFSWRVSDFVEVALRLNREGRVRGVFLSSSIFSDPDFVVERELEAVEALRSRGFSGYVHLRLMPGVSKGLILEAVRLADRVGLNLESPGRDSFEEVAPDKGDYVVDVLRRLEWVSSFAKHFPGVSVDSQLIYWRRLGSDLDYLRVAESLYGLGLSRVYFSPFRPIEGTPLGGEAPESERRAFRLYQASFLIRDYGFRSSDFSEIVDDEGNLPDVDPKLLFAERLLSDPIDLNSASFRELLLIPGVGPGTARKIISLRETGKLDLYNLRRILGRRRLKLLLRYARLGP